MSVWYRWMSLFRPRKEYEQKRSFEGHNFLELLGYHPKIERLYLYLLP